MKNNRVFLWAAAILMIMPAKVSLAEVHSSKLPQAIDQTEKEYDMGEDPRDDFYSQVEAPKPEEAVIPVAAPVSAAAKGEYKSVVPPKPQPGK